MFCSIVGVVSVVTDDITTCLAFVITTIDVNAATDLTATAVISIISLIILKVISQTIMVKVINIKSFKGGVGKTTTAVNVAHSLALKGKRVLLVDLDQQGNATQGLGYRIEPDQPTIYHVLTGEVKRADATATVRENLDLLPSDNRTAAAETALHLLMARESVLKKNLGKLDEYDYVIFDCSPNHGLLHINSLLAATHILVPIEIGFWSIEGVDQIFRSMEEVGEAFGTMPELLGALLTNVDERYAMTREVRGLCEQSFGERILPIVRTDAELRKAPRNGQTIFEFNPQSKGATDYNKVTDAILEILG